MAKKNFKSGLGDLLDNAMTGTANAATKNSTQKSAKETASDKSNKSFMSNLDDLFQEQAIEESVREQAEKIKQNKPTVSKRKKPMFGLDALIRETVETSQAEVMPKNTKRVTFVFDEEKINKLQQLARLKKAYVKDIVNEIISEYLMEQKIVK